nr:hypothetical protein [Arsukibacterium sp.]
MKIVPTTDINMTAALAIGVFILMIGYSIRIKGVLGFIKELTLHPFSTKMCRYKSSLIPANLLLGNHCTGCQTVFHWRCGYSVTCMPAK